MAYFRFLMIGIVLSAGAVAHTKSLTVLSDVYHIDQIYKSMMGPHSMMPVHVGDPATDEVVWVTGYETVVVDESGKRVLPDEYMCHSNLDFQLRKLKRKLKTSGMNSRAFTLSQGQLSVKFPEGFGIPVVSSVPFKLYTQVLNLNDIDLDKRVRHKVTIHYIPQSEVKGQMVPMFTSAAYGVKGLNDESQFYNRKKVKSVHTGSACLTGEGATHGSFTDRFGQKFTGHWVVAPGREVNRSLVTDLMVVPYDTTIHYIAVHMHPFAESLTLVDLTTGETLFKSKMQNTKDRIGLEHVDYYSSKKGIPVYKDHEYEIVSVYNNTSIENQDAMAVMYLYMKDKKFQPL